MEKAKRAEIVPLIVSIVISQAAGGIGGAFTARAIPTWYAKLTKPAETPPNWVFGPVWTTLYTLMGVASFLVWRKGPARPDVRQALGVFGAQLALNTLWSVVFFGFRSLGGGMAVIAVLWGAVLATIWRFSRLSIPAGLLLVPYLAWTSFAGYLNFRLWMLNR
ncbi:MAG: tryptophan-rich sensory protein [Bacteroidetes bacterium]|nr:tryptophan-rich sensory protein [Bacteroidota bacterium]MCL5025780.1 tryptophan-rich sensory protein [Chloroflexota bacterium]